MIIIPMQLDVLTAKAGGWRWRLQAIENSAISWLSTFEGFPTVAAAQADAHQRITAFNVQYARKIKMTYEHQK